VPSSAPPSVSDATPVPPTPTPPGSDPVRALLRAACRAARHMELGRACRVVVYVGDRRAIDVVIPESVADGEMRRPVLPAAPAPETPALPPGWSFTDKFSLYDGRIVKEVAPSRVKLLRVLVEATAGMTAKELARAVFGEHGDEESARFHIRELRKELKAAFASFEADAIPNDGAGYRLILR
jgi:hypothetical protein